MTKFAAQNGSDKLRRREYHRLVVADLRWYSFLKLKNMKRQFYHTAPAQLFFNALMLVAILFTSCASPKEVIVERTVHDTLHITKQQRDSIFLHDSIYVREHSSGDTVFMETDRWHTLYRDRWLHDSIYAVRVDSVPVPYPVEKKVPARLNWFLQMQLWLGRLMLVALAVWLIRKRAWWLTLLSNSGVRW
jgi:hypothetical protein